MGPKPGLAVFRNIKPALKSLRKQQVKPPDCSILCDTVPQSKHTSLGALDSKEAVN